MSIVTTILKAFVGDKSKNDIKSIQPIVEAIKREEHTLQNLTHDQLRAKTVFFKETLQQASAALNDQIKGLQEEIANCANIDEREKLYDQIDQLEESIHEVSEKTLSELLPQAFAVVRETARRFKENEILEVTASAYDRELSATRSYVTLNKIRILEQLMECSGQRSRLGYGALRRATYWRYHHAPRKDRRDANR
jgi:preprotein translocase subunit SecA